MIAYLYLMNKVYPARVNDAPNLLYYEELVEAHFKLVNSDKDDEILLLNYRNAFFFFKNHVYNAVNDAYRMIKHELDDFDTIQFEHNMTKLENTHYNMDRLLEVISHFSFILSGYNLDRSASIRPDAEVRN
ncbi:hypothetical protein [Pedobacter endophyticus]|uniref:Uncharacterized protein n=1 Tax=Pedobacter endophyticus TaxID=2789740 RepID=A0A7S9KZK7_9SPHI|nr:hypothetical protein [Pedobacter endophyticus]QPH39735.1 hypothetical protein IZT61_00175 [Pedobacter endophyticus]